jgi:acyl-ACP thioesterase
MVSVDTNKVPEDIRWREEYSIRSSEVDGHQRATPLAILHLIQEASMGSARSLGASIDELQPLNLAWVLLRKSFTIIDRPKLSQRVSILTYPSHFDRFLAYRDYKMYDLDGRLMAYASSTWTLLNFVDRKMAGMPEFLQAIKVHPDEPVLDPPPSRLSKISDIIHTEDVKVKSYDIDWNGHVNNLSYVRYVLENVPKPYRQRELKRIDFHIKAEAFLDDEILVESGLIGAEDGRLAHRLSYNRDDHKLIASVETYWT